MIPILYEATTTSFTNNGIGHLADCGSCFVTEERNGAYELELTYPMNGRRYADLGLRKIILAKPNGYANPQPFRIYQISAPMNGMVTVSAQHICYDMCGYPIAPFTANTLAEAITALDTAVDSYGFSITTTKSSNNGMTISVPVSVKSAMGGIDGSVLDTYGGEWSYDGKTATLKANRGSNRGVQIRYGKNLTSLTQESLCSEVYTAVLPYWKDEKSLVTGSQVSAGSFNYTRVLPLDLSSEFQKKPTAAQLEFKAQTYINRNNVGTPKVSLSLSFLQLSQSNEYANLGLLEKIVLCDTVTVIFPDMGVNATAKVISLTYNVLLDRTDSVELGEPKQKIADTIKKIDKKVAAHSASVANPHLVGASQLLGLETGTATVTVAANSLTGSVGVTFNSEFAAAPRVMLTFRGNYPRYINIVPTYLNASSTGFSIVVRKSATTSSAESFYVDWIAVEKTNES